MKTYKTCKTCKTWESGEYTEMGYCRKINWVTDLTYVSSPTRKGIFCLGERDSLKTNKDFGCNLYTERTSRKFLEVAVRTLFCDVEGQELEVYQWLQQCKNQDECPYLVWGALADLTYDALLTTIDILIWDLERTLR